MFLRPFLHQKLKKKKVPTDRPDLEVQGFFFFFSSPNTQIYSYISLECDSIEMKHPEDIRQDQFSTVTKMININSIQAVGQPGYNQIK